MAITLIKKPDPISPVFSDRNKFEMSEAGAAFFTLIFSGDVSGTFKIFPNPSGVAEFNARYFLADYIKSLIALPGISPLPDGLKDYSLTIVASTGSQITNVSGGFKFFNGALQNRETNKAHDGFILNNMESSKRTGGYFNGIDSKLIFDDLTGVNIVRYQGTSTLSIVGNEIHGTEGYAYNLLLDNGCFFSEIYTGDGEVIAFKALFNRVLDTSANYNIYDIFNES